VDRVDSVIIFCIITALKLKVKVALEQSTKTQKGSRGITLLFL
jgi:hypothetical protein